jgi:Tfp pilus assembly protein PilV
MKWVWPLTLRTRERGFSVVEVLLAVTVFGLVATAVIGAIIYGRASSDNAIDHTQANYLAEEGLEATRNIGAASFANLVDSGTSVGNTTVQSSQDNNLNSTNAYKVTTGSTTSGAVNYTSAYIKAVDGAAPLVQMAIYADSAGSPGTLLGTSAIQTAVPNSWNIFVINGVTVAPSTNYWVALSVNGGTWFASTIGGGTAGSAKYDITSGYPAPSTFSVDDNQPDKMSFYMSVAGTYGIAKLANVWAFSGVSDVTGAFTRTVAVTSLNTNRKLITSTVTWPQNSGTGQTSVSGELTNWRATIKSWANATNPTASSMGAIAGIKVATLGSYVYLVENSTSSNFLVIDISNPSVPAVTSTVSTSATPTNVAVSGHYVYITSSTAASCLKIYDVTNEYSPVLVKTLAATGSAGCNGVFVNGNYAYVVRTLSATAGSNEFNVVNVTTPASASIVGGYNNDSYTMNEVWASGNYAYVAATGTVSAAEMAVINVTTPTAPTLAGTFNPSGSNTALTIIGSGNTVYLGYGTTLNSVNVTTPATPANLGTFTAASTVRDVDIDPTSQVVFMGTASTTGEFQVVNVATPATMTLVKTLDLSGTAALTGVAYNSMEDLVVGASSTTTAQLRIMMKN